MARCARNRRVFACQRKYRLGVREPREPEFRHLDAVAVLTIATQLTEMNILVTTRARSGRQLEANIQHSRTGRTRPRPIGRDVALAARCRGMPSGEEFRKAGVIV